MTGDEERLYLYETRWCFYCHRVRAAARRLGIEIPSRDVARHEEYRAELETARGRARVPVLRIVRADGEQWMPESNDIIAYLQRRFG